MHVDLAITLTLPMHYAEDAMKLVNNAMANIHKIVQVAGKTVH